MIPVASETDFAKIAAFSPHDIDFILLETKVCHSAHPASTPASNYYGGSGLQFDWSILESYPSSIPFILTGGITPDDAPRIRSIRHPKFAGVDINSRFELSPALKDCALIASFIQSLRTPDAP